ncbi:cache domain-containing sensor histidine kinase [Paenibacillus puerhi]|uniref:cache domain-containing sensor histidine kinase n=1 Tax=Paenibacillus puerhi TaxID=2692622 RepID=UPI0013590C06|nr:sensor histidine kinase [Paenibacillus puerhi]
MRTFHLNHVKLRDKWLLIYVLSVFIPIVLTNVIFYHVTTTNIRNQKVRDATLALEKTKSELQSVIDEAAGISYLLYSDPVLNEGLNRDYPTQLDYVEAYNTQLRAIFDKYNQVNQTIKWIGVYTSNPTILASGNIRQITESVRYEEWYKTYTRISAPYPTLLHTGDEFSLVLRMNNFSSDSNIKILKIELNMNSWSQKFNNSTFDGQLYLVNPDGLIEYSDDSALDWKSGRTPITSLVDDRQTLKFEMPYTNSNYLGGWSLQGSMNESVVLEEVRKSRGFVIYLACLNFFIPTFIIASMSRSIHVRLVRLLRHMKKVKNQNFEAIPNEEYRDEIGQLTAEFNRMTFRIKTLIDDVYVAEIQKKDLELKQRQAQLHALHSQINPHFLFNALETIRMRSLIKGEGETAKIIQSMAKIFRKSISWGRDWVSVREELELIECFLDIQKYRFGDKLEYRIHVDPAAYERNIPKMTFLPFVENASIHGIESSPGKGLIEIRIEIEQDELVFTLKDNGSGMPADKLEEIDRYLKQDDSMGDRVGMKNAYYRLLLCYKHAFGFHIESEEGVGTLVQLRLPSDTGSG